MNMIIDRVVGFVATTSKNVDYIVTHMNLTQWGIFAFAALGMGIVCMRGRHKH